MQKEHFRIFVVEDDEWYNRFLVHHLSMNPEYEVKGFSSGTDLLKSLHETPDVITLDYRLPDIKGNDLLGKIKLHDESIEIIVISGQEDVQTAVDLLKEGAFDYLVKSENIQARLHNTIQKIRDNAGLRKRIQVLEKEVVTRYGFEKAIIGNSPAMAKVLEIMHKGAESNITVTITGETGTGKEVIAKAIHYNSARKNKPFVAVNMSAIPAELFESEFFGHEKGAFTGAVARRKGKFEEAEGGTIFLDEITDTDISFQPKLLRALQEREIIRVGSNEPVRFDCRLIVASNRNLQQEVKKGTLRQDLFYRIFGLPIELPPLRERGKDILLLSKYFIENFCKENNLPLKEISNDACDRLMQYPWPGNVRELRSVIELAIIMSSGPNIKVSDILFSQADILYEIIGEEMSMKQYNKRILDYYLNKYQRNMPVIASKLGISMATIYRMLKDQ
ncbi:MAG: sigma-54 dependent transcriptional regulator [Bacteroidales bacterium]|jgi:DNA-binding NtrC family response regulator|nr:sigma-54 dependent transcriptional regulator [Bacteroidales bacterium]